MSSYPKKEGSFGRITHDLGVLSVVCIEEGGCVGCYGFGEKALYLSRGFAEEALDAHSILRERPRLVGADDGDSTHRLAGVHTANEVVATHHATHAIGQRETHTHW